MAKKPDQVVHNEEDGYYASKLPYTSNVGAPAINIVDISSWKATKASHANEYYVQKFNELKEEYQKLISSFQWNDLIYQAEYSFQPTNGHSYYLYERGPGGSIFLSLVSPDQWGKKYGHLIYIGKFALDSNDKWDKLPD